MKVLDGSGIIVTVDPATQITGLAISEVIRAIPIGPVDIQYQVKLGYSAAIKAQDKKADWPIRANSIITQVTNSLSTYMKLSGSRHTFNDGNKLMIIELPTRYFSEKGEAANNSDATIKIAAIAGMFSLLGQHRGFHVEFITAPEWKGNVTKEITQRRVSKHWGVPVDTDDNEADAIGIMDWYFRRFLSKRGMRYHIIRHEES